MCPFHFSIPKAWNIGKRINNAHAILLCASAFIPSGLWLKSPSAPRFTALLHGTVSGFFISDGYLGADTDTDRISEPRMIQESHFLKINQQTVPHWSRLFLSFCITLGKALHQRRHHKSHGHMGLTEPDRMSRRKVCDGVSTRLHSSCTPRTPL